MHKCSKCKVEKSLDSFPMRTGKRAGKPQAYCYNCRREYFRQTDIGRKDKRKQHKEKMRQWIVSQKNKSCLDCGKSYPYYIMEFDHLTDKKFSISQSVARRGWNQIKSEIVKCELVCSNCHKERTCQRGYVHSPKEPTSNRPQRKTERKYRQKCKNLIRKSKETPCVDCGIQYPHYVMQFDHMRDKKYTISQMYNQVGLPTIKKEIAKCEVVCANCHAERTYG